MVLVNTERKTSETVADWLLLHSCHLVSSFLDSKADRCGQHADIDKTWSLLSSLSVPPPQHTVAHSRAAAHRARDKRDAWGGFSIKRELPQRSWTRASNMPGILRSLDRIKRCMIWLVFTVWSVPALSFLILNVVFFTPVSKSEV